jgi:hypothetical protein
MAKDWLDHLTRRPLLGVSRRRLLQLTAAGLMGAALVGPPHVAAAREIIVEGIIDCGRMSGDNCPGGTQLTMITDQLGQNKQRVTIDMSWFPRLLENYSQDDLISLRISDDSGHWRAVGLVEPGQPAPTRQKEDENNREQ